jgi:hypothetical protein
MGRKLGWSAHVAFLVLFFSFLSQIQFEFEFQIQTLCRICPQLYCVFNKCQFGKYKVYSCFVYSLFLFFSSNPLLIIILSLFLFILLLF